MVTFDATGMSTAKTFAACYTEGDGTTSASWVDSGIRLTISKVTSVAYSTPTRVMTSNFLATNRLPQVTGVTITYSGDLDQFKWLSLVDLNLNGGNPCVVGTLVRKSVFDEAGGFDESYPILEDWALWQECFKNGARIYHVDDAKYKYFIRDGSRNHNKELRSKVAKKIARKYK